MFIGVCVSVCAQGIDSLNRNWPELPIRLESTFKRKWINEKIIFKSQATKCQLIDYYTEEKVRGDRVT